MKTCRDCVNYAKCVENCNTYHASRLTPDSDVSDRCEHFEHKAAAVNTVVYCKKTDIFLWEQNFRIKADLQIVSS